MTIQHYIGVWPPGTRDDATVKAGTGAIDFATPTSESEATVQQLLDGLTTGSYEVEWLAEDGAESARATKAPVTIVADNEAPTWGTIPDQSDAESDLPQALDVAPYLTDPGFPASVTYSLVTPPTGFAIVGSVIIADGAAVDSHTITVRADNGQTADTSFTWEITQTLTAPVWDTPISDQTDNVTDQPLVLTVGGNASGNPAPTFSLISPPTGFTMTNATTGEITVDGASVDVHSITCRATNSENTADDTFTWDLQAALTAPVWDTPIDDQIDAESTLPQTITIGSNASGNPAPSFSLIAPPTGFTVTNAATGEIRADGASPGANALVCRATNSVNHADDQFTWEIIAPPEWDEPLPDQSNQQSDGGRYDLSLSLASNGYPAVVTYSLIAPPAGFTIDGTDLVCAPGTALNNYTIGVRAGNGADADTTINWQVAASNTAPSWDTEIDDQTDAESTLPQTVVVGGNASGYPQPTISLDPGTAGFSVTDVNTGAIQALNPAPGRHSISAKATNIISSATDVFFWDITTPPEWTEPLPAQTNEQSAGGRYDLALSLSDTGYPTSVSYSLVTPPAGFTLEGSELVCAAGTALDSYTITVRAGNGADADTTIDWDVTQDQTVPVWDTPIPDQSNAEATLPQSITIGGNVIGSPQPTITLDPPTAGFSVTDASAGTIEALNPSRGLHSINAKATNSQGAATDVFTWEITAPPVWDEPLPSQSNQQAHGGRYDLALSLSDTGYPAAVSYSIITPPAGFTLEGSELVCAPGTALDSYTISVRAGNGADTDTTIDWDVTQTLVAPIWDTPIPDQEDTDIELPRSITVGGYVSATPAATFSLVSPPAGFSMANATTGEILADGASVAAHSITCRATNSEGFSDDVFVWEITETPAAPVWVMPVPNQSTRGDRLPREYTVGGYVDGFPPPAFSLISPPAGFTMADPATGRILAEDGLTAGNYQLTCRAENSEGSADDMFFWSITPGSDVIEPPEKWGDTQTPGRPEPVELAIGSDPIDIEI